MLFDRLVVIPLIFIGCPKNRSQFIARQNRLFSILIAKLGANSIDQKSQIAEIQKELHVVRNNFRYENRHDTSTKSAERQRTDGREQQQQQKRR